MDLVIECKSKGVNRKRTCELLQIDERRVRNWFCRYTLVDTKPGPAHALHALLPQERAAIVGFAKDENYVDDSHRVLAAKCIDLGSLAVSASTVYRVMREEGLTTDRSGHGHRNGNSRKPDRPQLTGPNQRWCWDISYLRTLVPGVYLYLYVLLDEYSRKVISWRVSWSMTHREAQELLQDGLDKEGIADVDVKLPDLINDRGTQMKARPFMKFLKELGVCQKFSRPRTPNDNPFIESLFATAKQSSTYPDTFRDDLDAIAYFTAYFDFYNNVRLHGKIGYVTPAQRHRGDDKAILSARRERLVDARNLRLQVNRCVREANLNMDAKKGEGNTIDICYGVSLI